MAQQSSIEKPPDMADLLEYFESRSRTLDAEGQTVLEASTLQFMSLIRFNGVPILPPVLTARRREEMMSYKHEALRRTKVKKREEVQAKVQSIVAGVEERRAAKQAARSSSGGKSVKSSSPAAHRSAGRTQSPKTVSRVVSKPTSSPGTATPSEIIISVSSSVASSHNLSGSTNASSPQSKGSSRSSSKSGMSSKTATDSLARASETNKKKEPTNYKSLGKLGGLTKQKSFSSQHLDRTGLESNAGVLPGSTKAKSLSPKPVGLFPHPPEGRPPSRGSSMRQSASTPDLRFIEASIKAEDLRQPLPKRRSLSPKGGRPQASEKPLTERPKPSKDTVKPKERSKKDTSLKSKDIVTDTRSKTVSSERKVSNSKKGEISPSSRKGEKQERNAKSKVNQGHVVLQNPLELLEQELSLEEESERNRRLDCHSGAVRSEINVQPELDPIQTATAELFPYPISEEQALATLDSLQSDFASLEQQDALPKDYNGIPLTSVKQQQIIHMLTKLSQALNMEDTGTLTASAGTFPLKGEVTRDIHGPSSKSENWCDSRSVPNGAYGRDYGSNQSLEGGDGHNDSPVNLTQDSAANSSSNQNTSASSAHSRARMSPTGSSILSSASSVSASRSRMSPKSLKNTVHFSTLVTEISTSASQSYEDKIVYRKLDITPRSSENFEESESSEQTHDMRSSTQQGASGPNSGLNLLGKVALTPSVDSSSGSPGEFQPNHPFDDHYPDGELNTSDKENEFVPPPEDDSSDEHYSGNSGRGLRPGRNQQVYNVYMANMPAGPLGENHPVLEKSSLKSELPDNVMKFAENLDKAVLQENLGNANQCMDTQFYYGTGSADLERYMKGNFTPHDSISSLQDEITRSYLFSKQIQENGLLTIPDSHFEAKKPSVRMNESEHSDFDMDNSAVHLKPIVLTGMQSSLQENRSMLEDEEQIRTNLQRVLFDDTDDESDENDVQEADRGKCDQKVDLSHKDNFESRQNAEGIKVKALDEVYTEIETSEPERDENEASLANKEKIEEFTNMGKKEVSVNDYMVDQGQTGEVMEYVEEYHGENTKFEGEDTDNDAVCDDIDRKSEEGIDDDDSDDHDDGEEEEQETDESDGDSDENDEQAPHENTDDNVDNVEPNIPSDINLPSDVIDTNIGDEYRKADIEIHAYSETDEPVKNDWQIRQQAHEVEDDHDLKIASSKNQDLNVPKVKQITETGEDRVKVSEACEPERTGNNDQEEEAKADHIQKYLNQVHEQSLRHDPDEELYDDVDDVPVRDSKSDGVMDDIGTLIQSFTASIQSMNHLSQEELFKMQAEQFELIQKKLIEHQQAQLEELFVAQRREQMNLQEEIEMYHQNINQKQSDIDMMVQSLEKPLPAMSNTPLVPPASNAPFVPPVVSRSPYVPPAVPESPLVPQMSHSPRVPQMSKSTPQVKQAWQGNSQTQSATLSPPFQIKPVPPASNFYQNPHNVSFNTSTTSSVPFADPRTYMDPRTLDPRTLMEANIDPRSGVGVSLPPMGPGFGFGMGGNSTMMPSAMMGFAQDPNLSSISHNTSYSTIPLKDPGMMHGGLVPAQGMATIQSQDPPASSSHSSNPFIYPSSPSLYINPKDRDMCDNASEVSGFAKATPKQLVFSNQSTPVAAKIYKPIQHSPVKKVSSHHKQDGRLMLPEKVNSQYMKPKFDRVSAAVKGYLTRRLLKTQKVQDIIKTIDDTRKFAFSFQAETPIKSGQFSRSDTILLERIVNQLGAGLMDIHDIFFEMPVAERMAIISASRQLEEEKHMRDSQWHHPSRESVSRSQPRLSAATLKAMERKKKAKLAEEAVFGSVEFRPKSAPPVTSSPASDISGPLQRHYHSLFARALRPLQGHMSPIQAENTITVREMKERPKSAQEKRRSSNVNSKAKKSSGSKSARTSTGTSSTATTNKQRSSKDKGAKTQGKSQQKTDKSQAKTDNSAPKPDKAWR